MLLQSNQEFTCIKRTNISPPFISRKLVMARTEGQLRNLSSLKSSLHTQWRTVSGILMVFQLISLRGKGGGSLRVESIIW